MRFYFVVGLLLVLVSACNDSEQTTQPLNSNSAPPSEQESKQPTVSMTAMNTAEFDKLVASHKGKVVVVDLWALW